MKNIVVRWFIPVIAIPSLWPIQSIVDNQFIMAFRCLASEHSSDGGHYCNISEFHYCAHVIGFFGIADGILKKETISLCSGFYHSCVFRQYFILSISI